MLVGISALTALGLRRYYGYLEANPLPDAVEVCDGRTRCQAYSDLLAGAGIPQEQVVFAGAAVCAGVAGLLALALFRGAPTRQIDTAHLVGVSG